MTTYHCPQCDITFLHEDAEAVFCIPGCVFYVLSKSRFYMPARSTHVSIVKTKNFLRL